MSKQAYLFVDGWYYGALYGEATPAAAATSHPRETAADLDAFCQGSVDGAIEDEHRLQLIRDQWLAEVAV